MDNAAASRPILSRPVLAWHDGKVDHKTNHDSYYLLLLFVLPWDLSACASSLCVLSAQ